MNNKQIVEAALEKNASRVREIIFAELYKRSGEAVEELIPDVAANMTNKESEIVNEEYNTEAEAKAALDRHQKKFPSKRLSVVKGKSGMHHVVQHTSGGMSRVSEEVEETDEISKKTPGSHLKKASRVQGPETHMGNIHAIDDARAYSPKRQRGIDRATDKLTKEETEITEVEAPRSLRDIVVHAIHKVAKKDYPVPAGAQFKSQVGKDVSKKASYHDGEDEMEYAKAN